MANPHRPARNAARNRRVRTLSASLTGTKKRQAIALTDRYYKKRQTRDELLTRAHALLREIQDIEARLLELQQHTLEL